MAHKKSKPNPKVPKTDIFAAKKNVPSTVFKRFYERNDLPVVCSFSGATRSIEWKVNIDMLDYHHYLPVFFEGLREQDDQGHQSTNWMVLLVLMVATEALT